MACTHDYKALRVYLNQEAEPARIERLACESVGHGEVLIAVRYSSLNYKDALAVTGQGRILRRSPLTAGIDAAGIVSASRAPSLKEGDAVLVTGCGLSEECDGGFAQYLRVPAASVIPLPTGLSLSQAMLLGTAGFSAALAISRMQDNDQRPDQGAIVVTGASGGVGGFAVYMLNALGYQVIAVSGKPQMAAYLRGLGAQQVIDRHSLEFDQKPLSPARWGGAIDVVGAEMLDGLIRSVSPWGNVVSVGLVGGAQFNASVMPFILRGVSLLGVSSANCPRALRERIWQRLAGELRPAEFDVFHRETISLEQVPDACLRLLQGQSHARVLVRIDEDDT